MPDKIQANMILEIMGRPPEHLKEALNTLVVKLGSEKGVEILTKNYHEPKKIEDSEDLFTAFAELLIEFDELGNFFGVIFAYMPAHIEIIKPESIKLANSDLNDTGNTLIQRLHSYDAIAKKMIHEREFLLNQLKTLDPELYKKLTTPPPNQKSDSPKEKSNESLEDLTTSKEKETNSP
jgi:hypothetical protein